jgi:hypothetical protein
LEITLHKFFSRRSRFCFPQIAQIYAELISRNLRDEDWNHFANMKKPLTMFCFLQIAQIYAELVCENLRNLREILRRSAGKYFVICGRIILPNKLEPIEIG